MKRLSPNIGLSPKLQKYVYFGYSAIASVLAELKTLVCTDCYRFLAKILPSLTIIY